MGFEIMIEIEAGGTPPRSKLTMFIPNERSGYPADRHPIF
jgi:hypothetical protein